MDFLDHHVHPFSIPLFNLEHPAGNCALAFQSPWRARWMGTKNAFNLYYCRYGFVNIPDYGGDTIYRSEKKDPGHGKQVFCIEIYPGMLYVRVFRFHYLCHQSG